MKQFMTIQEKIDRMQLSARTKYVVQSILLSGGTTEDCIIVLDKQIEQLWRPATTRLTPEQDRIVVLEAQNRVLLRYLKELAYSDLLSKAAELDPGYSKTKREAIEAIAKAEERK